MTTPTIAVTCVANDQNGNPVAGAVFTARLDSTEVYQGFVVPERVQVVANASGIAVLNLWPNALGVAGSLYRVTAVNPDTGRKFLDTTISVPNSPCNLHEILVQGPYPTLDAAAQALVAAQGALAEVTALVFVAADSQAAAAASEAAAEADRVAALGSQMAAANSAAEATYSAGRIDLGALDNAVTVSTAQRNAAATSATDASTSAGTATTKAGEASTSATAAAASATTATTQATASAASAATSLAQANISTTKAGEAAASATASNTAHAASVVAQDAAVVAKTAAETANGTAQTAATTATTQAGISTTGATAATTAKDLAQAAQAAAEAARDGATAVMSGGAGGVLSGTYPNPGFAVDMATQGELNAHMADVANSHAVTKAQVGLGNADNTSDLDKPVSTAAQTVLNNKVSKTGDTMTGNLNVPSLNGGQLAGTRNKIINGKMEVAQLGASFVNVTNTARTLDRFQWNTAGVTSQVTVSQSTDAPNTDFQYSLRATVTTAAASIAAEGATAVYQVIEGFNVRDLIGRPFVLSFWVRSSKTGVHCASFHSSNSDRSFVMEYTIAVANTWEFKTVSVSAGLITAGTWNWGTGAGLLIRWSLAVGTTRHTGSPNSWQVGQFWGTANQVNCLDTIDNIFAITGVQLEVGSVATPFEHRLIGQELALCERYYQSGTFANCVGVQFGSDYFTSIDLGVAMRSQPTVTIGSIPALYANGSILTVSTAAGDNGTSKTLGFVFTTTTQPTNAVRILNGAWTASAEL